MTDELMAHVYDILGKAARQTEADKAESQVEHALKVMEGTETVDQYLDWAEVHPIANARLKELVSPLYHCIGQGIAMHVPDPKDIVQLCSALAVAMAAVSWKAIMEDRKNRPDTPSILNAIVAEPDNDDTSSQ